MTLRSYLIIMALATLLAWGAWTVTLYTIDPEITNWIGFALFYSSFFLSLTGTAAILGFLARFLVLKQELAFRLVKAAFRQSLFIAVLAVASLILLSQGMLNWLNALALALGISALEYLFLSLEPKRPKENI